MTKTGWWRVNFDITLGGERLSFKDLDTGSQAHILRCIADGYASGEIVEEIDEE